MISARRRPGSWAAALLAALLLLVGCSAGGHRATHTGVSTPPAGSAVDTTPVPETTAPHPAQTAPTPTTPAKVVGQVPTIAATSLVATIRPASAPGSPAPGRRPAINVPGGWLGAASVLPVLARQPGWVQVGLAQRPNESTAWVPAADVALAVDPYHIIINLNTAHLQLFNHGQLMGDFPVGIGLPSDPTPTGHFFVALFARPPSPGYGQFVIVTSAHSNTITDWEESGDAIVAIHGSLGSDAAIGTTGAAVSHGCIRLHNADLLHLRDVPAGTPIDIVS